MSESENAPRFSKAILGRILAVGLFVALGTFAVVQSMSGGKTAEGAADDQSAAANPGENDPDNKTLAGAAGNAANNISNGISKTAKSISGVFEKSKPSDSSANSFSPPSNNSFAKSKLSGPPQSKSFDSKKSTLPVVVSKPPAQPPTRYAQAQSGVPIIGNNNGFAARPPNVPSTKFGNNPAAGNLKNPLNSGTAEKLKTKVTDSANDLLQKSKSKAANAVESFKQNIGSGFGPTPKTNNAPAAKSPAQSSFGSTFQSGIGTRPIAPPAKTGTFQSAPKATQKSASFDTSRNLAPSKSTSSPFGSDSGTNQKPLGQITSRQKTNPPPSNKIGNSSFGNSSFGSSRAPTAAPATNPRPTQRPFTSAQPVSTNLSKTRPTSRLTTPASTANPMLSNNAPGLLTKDIPGDKQLEGVQAPALTVEKLSPREIQVNQTADFELVVKNVGRVAAENVRVFDQIPAGTEFQGSSPEPSQTSRNGDIQWTIGKLRPGQEKRIKLQLKPIRPGEIGSVAHVTFTTQASMRTLVTKPVLEIVHQAEQTHLIGDDVIFDVVVKNKGDGPALNVVIQEDVPKQLAVPKPLESPDGNRGIEYEIGTLMPGQSKRVKLALKAANIGKLRNVMYASADGGLQARHELPMEVVAPKLVSRTDGPTRRFLKRNVTHNFSVSNQGTAPATNVELVARLPSGLRFVDANNQGRYDANSHSVFWSLAELATHDVEAKVELKTMPVEVGNQPIKFESFADLKTRSAAEQPLSVEHLVDVFFDIDDVADPIEIGSNTSYRVRVVNQGTKASTNVQLQVDFPPGLLPTSVEGSLRHSISGQRIAFEPINSMNPGDEISFVIHGKGQTAGDHRVVVNMQTDGRSTLVSKEETTRVYSDR